MPILWVSAEEERFLMVDRRTVVVGGAAALAALAGGVSSAAASTVGAAETTQEHARRVLDKVNVELGLVNVEGAAGQMVDGLDVYLASPPRDPKANDFYAWSERRVRNLTGRKDELGAILVDDSKARALLGFGFACYTQHQGVAAPTITRSMPAPSALVGLESDFFPELHKQVDAKSASSPAFADIIDASTAELDRITIERATDDDPEADAFGVPAIVYISLFVITTVGSPIIKEIFED
jgi:hypothetical protein